MSTNAVVLNAKKAAANALDVTPKWLRAFEEPDPFNGDSVVRGFLCTRPDHRYGALYITHVDGAAAAQIIQATPKLNYPFDKTGTFNFPALKSVTFYDKLDGTNVLAFRYADAAGAMRQAYKLRLQPFVRNGRYGAFLDMWNELLQRYPAIRRVATHNACHVSFEMYGTRNPLLVHYEETLAVAALFGVRQDYGVVPVSRLDTLGLPTPGVLGTLRAGDDPVERYNALRHYIEAGNSATDDDKVVGTEGAVWFAEDTSSNVTMWKCKPESVEAIHWATGINKTAVLLTCKNALENSDILDFSTIKPLLLEEYTEQDIADFREHIDDILQTVNAELAFTERVLAAYAATGHDIAENKPAVMRALAQQFKRSEMKKVLSLIQIHAR